MIIKDLNAKNTKNFAKDAKKNEIESTRMIRISTDFIENLEHIINN